MTALTRSWSRLTLAGKIVLPLLIVGGGLTSLLMVAAALGLIAPVTKFLGDTLSLNGGIVRFLVAALAVLLFTVPTAFIVGFLELKVIAFMNLRLGPNRVGPWGAFSAAFHGFKILAKEDFTPTAADVPVFTLAPAVVFLAPVLGLLVLPFAPGLVALDMNIALLYFFAMGGIGVVGLMMAGWSSFNKYSLLGALRAAAQIISYEIPLTLSIVGVVILAGTLSLDGIVRQQGTSFFDWFALKQPLGFVIFFIAATAEGNRTPFDLSEADSEIVAGYATEYSGMRFGFFYFAEYVNLFLLSALTVVIFLGGWLAPFDIGGILHQVGVTVDPRLDPASLGIGLLLGLLIVPPLLVVALALPVWLLSKLAFWQSLIVGFLLFNVLAVTGVVLWAVASFDVAQGLLWFTIKSYGVITVLIWMRATLPRVRIDQLMGFAWKWLLPASLVNLFVTALAVVVVDAAKG
ncbi:MAG: complex I subunit 1/NuoH family protein [Candidatus Limnocylindrales bacterium]